MRGAPGGYTVGKSLPSSGHSEVCEAVRESDGLAVVLKGYAGERSGAAETRTQREFDALRRSAGAGIPRALELDRTTRRPLLVLERVPGATLARLLADGPLTLAAWLDLASGLADALACVHAARMLHKDVSPANVLFEPATRRAWLVDFGMAVELGAVEEPASHWGEAHEQASLPYIAPEQTGRMNRGCDFRSDLYSLGATLYQAWTGRPPCEGRDALELIHAHIARIPLPARELRTGLPAPLSRMLEKLLRKEPEERYQSARALAADLQACREEWTLRGDIAADFPLGSADATLRPHFSARLHGRERELARLRELYTRACSGVPQTLMIAGGPGVGKSALVDSLRPALVERGGYLAIGRFDPDRERPYAGWVRALGSLAQQLLMESDERLASWRHELRAGLGNIAQSLVDLVPDLGFVIGEVPAIPLLGPRETQARLSLALHRLLSVCATEQHPLVLSLDDLQWSDAGSRELLEDLLREPPISALLLIGAYRSDEVDAAHPLSDLLGRIEAAERAPERLELAPLAPVAALGMLAEVLDRPLDAVRGLADLIERKTGNYPLLVRQFLEVIHERGLLRHARSEGWTWDPAAVAAADIPGGAVALMTAKVDRLEPRERTVLELASCVGTEFDAALLCELGRRERTAVTAGLHALCDKGLIMPCPAGFRFAHDRIREAAQRLLSEAERSQLHCEIGRLLLERVPPEEHAARGEIVEHLNRGLDHLSADERIGVIELNLAAGKRTLAAGAAASATRYFEVARQLFAEEDWATRHALGFDVHMQSAESAFFSGELERTLEILAELEARPLGQFEHANVVAKRIQVFALTQQPEDCIRYALSVLRGMGVRWPLHPSRLRAELALRVLWWRMRGRTPEQFLRPARSLEPAWFAPLIPLVAASVILLRVDQRLATLATCFGMRRYLRKGYVRAPSYALAVFAGNSCLLLGDPERASRLARAALECTSFPHDPSFALKSEQAILSMVEAWRLPRRQSLAPLEAMVERGRELGDPEFAYYALFNQAYFRTLAGDPIRECVARFAKLGGRTRSSGADDYGHALRHLLSYPATGELERGLAESDARIDAAQGSTEAFVRTLWLLVLSVYGRPDLAFAESEKLGDRLFRVVPVTHVVDHTLYRGLAAADLARAARGRARWRYRRELRRALRRLRRWAVHGPDFVHMATLLAAEHERLQERASARLLFEQAAQRARQQCFPHHAAIAAERRARMLAEQRRGIEAGAAFREAIALYCEWGATPKAEALVQERRALTGA